MQLPGWLRRRWRQWRNEQLLDPIVQRKLSGFWLTRRRSQREAAETFDLVAGFVYSQVLLACHRLDLLALLRAGPLPQSQLLSKLDLPSEASQTLLRAATALDLLESDETAGTEPIWWLGSKGAALLGNPGALAMIEHHAVLYRDLADPVALLRAPRGSTELARYWPYATAGIPSEAAAEQIRAYTSLMAASQGLVADEILDAYDFRSHRRILDIGGGDGTFLRHVRQRAPQAQLVLFDLPAVAAEAVAASSRPMARWSASAVISAEIRYPRAPISSRSSGFCTTTTMNFPGGWCIALRRRWRRTVVCSWLSRSPTRPGLCAWEMPISDFISGRWAVVGHEVSLRLPVGWLRPGLWRSRSGPPEYRCKPA